MISAKKPRGTKDLYGEEIKQIDWICKKIIEKLKLFGYSEIKTPIFESINTFSQNDEGLLEANKEFFYVSNKDFKQLEYVLRPENTASVARCVSENKILKNNPITLSFYYCGPFFRYERPQKGRFRQFTQLGIEKINSSGIGSDLENIVLMEQIRTIFPGLEWKLHLNYLGSFSSKSAWGNCLTKYFQQFKSELNFVSLARLDKNPWRILDDSSENSKEFVKNFPRIDLFFDEQEKKYKSEIQRSLNELGIDFVWDESLVRGIDYYDGLVYEWKCGDLSVASGGRYDKLFSRFGDGDIPSSGLAIGIERLHQALESIDFSWNIKDNLSIYVCLNYVPTNREWDLFKFLRKQNFSVFVNYENLDQKKHIHMAEKMKKDFVIILENEIFVRSLRDWNKKCKFSFEETQKLVDFLIAANY